MKTRRLADGMGEDHEPAAVERDDEGQLQLTDDFQDALSMARIRLDYTFASNGMDVSSSEFLDQNGGRRMRQDHGPALFGKRQDRTVLGHHGVEEVQITSHASKVFQDSAGDKDHGDALTARLLDCAADIMVEFPVLGDRPS
jgi:hypothetical protein